MKERWIKSSILFLLVVLNAVLLFYLVQERRLENYVPKEQMDRILALYERNDIIFTEYPSTQNSSMPLLKLREADLEKTVEAFFGKEPYEQTFVVDNRVQYTQGPITLNLNWRTHSISYQDKEVLAKKVPGTGIRQEKQLSKEQELILEQLGRQFASRWLGEQVYLSEAVSLGDSMRLCFRQVCEEKIYYFNRIDMTISKEGIASANLVLWEVDDTADEVTTLPKDEMLYLILQKIEQEQKQERIIENAAKTQPEQEPSDEKAQQKVVLLMDGYEIRLQTEEQMIAVPNLTLVLDSEKKYCLKYTGE